MKQEGEDASANCALKTLGDLGTWAPEALEALYLADFPDTTKTEVISTHNILYFITFPLSA